MNSNTRKYTLGGFALPVKTEWPTLRNVPVRVIDAKGRLVRSFKSHGAAKALVAKLNSLQP